MTWAEEVESHMRLARQFAEERDWEAAHGEEDEAARLLIAAAAEGLDVRVHAKELHALLTEKRSRWYS